MDTMRVLVVDDEPAMARMLVIALDRAGLAVDAVHDGDAALAQLAINDYDVVVLDRGLPGVHGDEVCRQVPRIRPGCRVLMLTAARGLDDRVGGLELGADDYLVKPFELPELIARVRALYRRDGRPVAPVLAFAEIRLDTNRRTATRAGRPLRLTAKELAVLELLIRADGVLSSEQLLEKGWDEHADPFTNAVRVIISGLRRKLGPPPLIHTAINSGYYLAEQVPADDGGAGR